jgi:hypothetical protein
VLGSCCCSVEFLSVYYVALILYFFILLYTLVLVRKVRGFLLWWSCFADLLVSTEGVSVTAKLRGKTEAAWGASPKILESREAGVAMDTGRVKVGNGIDEWSDLPFVDAATQEVAEAALGGEFVLVEATPASAGATGVKGSLRYDDNYLYVCTDTNTWVRAAIAWS